MPEHSLVVLIGASGAGRSTIARTWPSSQVLFLDVLGVAVNDDFSVEFSVLSWVGCSDISAPEPGEEPQAPSARCSRALGSSVGAVGPGFSGCR